MDIVNSVLLFIFVEWNCHYLFFSFSFVVFFLVAVSYACASIMWWVKINNNYITSKFEAKTLTPRSECLEAEGSRGVDPPRNRNQPPNDAPEGKTWPKLKAKAEAKILTSGPVWTRSFNISGKNQSNAVHCQHILTVHIMCPLLWVGVMELRCDVCWMWQNLISSDNGVTSDQRLFVAADSNRPPFVRFVSFSKSTVPCCNRKPCDAQLVGTQIGGKCPGGTSGWSVWIGRENVQGGTSGWIVWIAV